MLGKGGSMKLIAIPVLLIAGSSLAGAQLLEGFEHNNLGLYTQAGPAGTNASLTAGAAHDGALGASFASGGASFYYRTDVATSAGNSYYGYFRFTGTSVGRIYMGVNAGAAGAWSAVAGNNTSEIQLQNNTGYTFSTVATSAFTFANDTWYSLQLDWANNGNMTVRLFNNARNTQLASTSLFSTGATGSGGFAMRAFSTNASNVNFDSFSAVPEPASMLALGAGLAALARRRRKA